MPPEFWNGVVVGIVVSGLVRVLLFARWYWRERQAEKRFADRFKPREPKW